MGLCAFKTTDQKAEAAAVFLRWLTEQQRNLEFAADTGYMPVSSAAFDAIADYPFEQQSYQRLVRQPAPAPEGLPPAPCGRRNAGSPCRGNMAAAV